MSRNPQARYHKLFLETIADNPGCDVQTIVRAGISYTTCCTLIGHYEFDRIRVQRSSPGRRITGIWLKEEAA
jgi:hypothetical protein